MVELAQSAFDDGDYRWAATLLDHLVFVEPDHTAGRELYADTLEQLGYGSENAPWRNFFLSGATELREGRFDAPSTATAPAIVAQLSPEQIFDAMAISVDGPKAWHLDLSIRIELTDLDVGYLLTLRNGVLIHRRSDAEARATLTLEKRRLLALLGGDVSSPGIATSGDASVLSELIGVIGTGDPGFAIVTP